MADRVGAGARGGWGRRIEWRQVPGAANKADFLLYNWIFASGAEIKAFKMPYLLKICPTTAEIHRIVQFSCLIAAPKRVIVLIRQVRRDLSPRRRKARLLPASPGDRKSVV